MKDRQGLEEKCSQFWLGTEKNELTLAGVIFLQLPMARSAIAMSCSAWHTLREVQGKIGYIYLPWSCKKCPELLLSGKIQHIAENISYVKAFLVVFTIVNCKDITL